MIRVLTILIILVGISFSSCKKKEDPQPNTGSEALTFTSLTAENSTIDFGTGTLITATATGQDLTYVWSTSVGILSGSGSQIEYFACCVGTYVVSCVVKDSNNNSEEKKVTITVE